MRQPTAVALVALFLCGCSVLSIDIQPRIRPLEEETLEGRGSAKILLVDLSGVLQDESVSFSLGAPPPRVPLLARVREELEKIDPDLANDPALFPDAALLANARPFANLSEDVEAEFDAAFSSIIGA